MILTGRMGIGIEACKTTPVASVTMVSVSSSSMPRWEDTQGVIHEELEEEEGDEREEDQSRGSSRSSSKTCYGRSSSFCHAYRTKRRRSSARSLSSSFDEYPFDGASSNTLSSSLSSIQLLGIMSEEVTVHPLSKDGCVFDIRKELSDEEEEEEQFYKLKCDTTTQQRATLHSIDSSCKHKREVCTVAANNIESSLHYLLKVLKQFTHLTAPKVSLMEATKANTGVTFQEELQLQSLASMRPPGFSCMCGDVQSSAAATPQFISVALNGKARRLREERANSNYLKFYALVLSNKKNLDKITNEELDIFDQFLFEFYDESRNLLGGDTHSCDPYFYEMELQRRLTLCSNPNSYFRRFNTQLDGYLSLEYLIELKTTAISRHKLWTTMTLNPRMDEVPTFDSIKQDIVPCDTTSVTNMEFPWKGLKDFQVKKSASGIGISGNKFTQYISKGSKSKRMAVINNT